MKSRRSRKALELNEKVEERLSHRVYVIIQVRRRAKEKDEEKFEKASYEAQIYLKADDAQDIHKIIRKVRSASLDELATMVMENSGYHKFLKKYYEQMTITAEKLVKVEGHVVKQKKSKNDTYWMNKEIIRRIT